MRPLAFRVISGAIAAAMLLVPAATATASTKPTAAPSLAPGPPTVTGGAVTAVGREADRGKREADRQEREASWGETPDTVKRLPFRLTVSGATARGAYEIPVAKGPAAGRSGRVTKADGRLTVTLEVAGETRCGTLQMTTNGPADGVEWYTFGVLCKSGTATFRTEATRLPWTAGTLPSIRLCNGLSPAPAEGDDCDGYEPPRTA